MAATAFFRRRRFAASPIALALAGAIAPASPAAQSLTPVFRVSQDLVLVDVVATGRDGALVTDLRAEEFELTEDGKPQRILQVQFSNASTLAPGAVEALPAAAPAQPQVAAGGMIEWFAHGAPADAPVLVIAFDVHSMQGELLARAHQAVLEVIGGLAPATRLMLVTLDRGLVVRQPFTTDVGAFTASLRSVAQAPEADMMDFEGFVAQADNTCGGASDPVDLLSARQQALGLGRLYLADVSVRMSAALDGLGALARMLAPLPGRKHVVLYSTGYPTRPVDAVIDVVGALCGDRGGVAQSISTSMDTTGWMQSAIDDMNRAQVSLYAVDPQGLVPDNVQAKQFRSARASARGGQLPEIRNRRGEIQQFLRTMAGDTGGVAALNTNDATRGLRAAAADASQYYLLAFSPQGSRRPGRYYKLGLKTTRPGVSLRYRQGYLWLDAKQRAERDVTLAARFPDVFSDPPIDVVGTVEGRRVKVGVVVPTSSLRFAPVGGDRHLDLHVAALLRDAQGRVVGERFLFAKDVAMKLAADRHADLMSHENIEIPGEGDAPRAGKYDLVVVVRHAAGRLSARSVPLDVP